MMLTNDDDCNPNQFFNQFYVLWGEIRDVWKNSLCQLTEKEPKGTAMKENNYQRIFFYCFGV
jgi:hypothetical protein